MAPIGRPSLSTNRLGVWVIFSVFLLALSSSTFFWHARSGASASYFAIRDAASFVFDSLTQGGGDSSLAGNITHSLLFNPRPDPGPAHQNPAKAPPEPQPEALGISPPELTRSPLLGSNLTSRAAYRDHLHDLHRRQALRCDDGPCIDDSCCSKEGICGYGPDFCGDGVCRDGDPNCYATAMCGEYSERSDGSDVGVMPCGMKLCCSAMGWCGTTESYCHNADPGRGTLPCQAGYGSCAITGPPGGCSEDSGSSSGRTIGYYQSWNVRKRLCNTVSPKQLVTTGYTHLFYAFASIDPVTFRITPAHSDDLTMMREFTQLKRDPSPEYPNGLQTWIAIGGFDFSDPETPTHTTWSDLCRDEGRRSAFVASVREYMEEYGFQGVDLDWEYPGDPKRGGSKLDDVKNLPLLVSDLRRGIGADKGLSLTLAPDYWYLRWFDAKVMEDDVNFFGFMAYDLHGSWDQDVKALGKKVRGQADIREIANNTIPLWFEQLNPAKLNFGLAMYGRGYTLADPTCNQLLCPFSGPSKPAPCTGFAGVMSLLEIQQLIKKKGIQPQLLDSMMKQITWDDQWIGYDDEETFALKRRWANSRCFGGTMIWSIDFQVAGTGVSDEDLYGDPVYIGTEVFTKPTAQCTPPCIMVFPPETRAPNDPVIFTIPPYTATLQIGSTTTIVTPVPSSLTTTVTVINYFNNYVTSSQQPGETLTLYPSLEMPPVTMTVTGVDGSATARTVFPPPLGKPGMPTTGLGDGTLPIDNAPVTPIDEVVQSYEFPTWTWTSDAPLGTEEPVVWPTGGAIQPAEEDDDDDDDHVPVPVGFIRLPCKLWFFWLCIAWEGIKVDFWDFSFPPGIIGPGPPPIPLLKLPKGWSMGGCDKPTGCLPPWPKLTIGPNGQFEPPPEPSACTPHTAMLTILTTSYGTTTTQGTVSTVTTRTLSKEFPLVGCAAEDADKDHTVTGCAAPTPIVNAAIAETEGAAAGKPRAENEHGHGPIPLAKRAPPGCDDPSFPDIVVFPLTPQTDLSALYLRLDSDKLITPQYFEYYHIVSSRTARFTAYIYFSKVWAGYLSPQFMTYYGLRANDMMSIPRPVQPAPAPNVPRDEDGGRENANATAAEESPLEKRAETNSVNWALPFISVPPRSPVYPDYMDEARSRFAYRRHASECAGQFAYVVEDLINIEQGRNTMANVQTLRVPRFGIWSSITTPGPSHGSMVASQIVGNNIGVCNNHLFTLVKVENFGSTLPWPYTDPNLARFPNNFPPAHILLKIASLVLALEDILSRTSPGASVINMSWGTGYVDGQYIVTVFKLVLTEIHDKGIAMVVAAGNDGSNRIPNALLPFTGLPATMAPIELPNLILVGAASKHGQASLFSRGAGLVDVYAPGDNVAVDSSFGALRYESGTSFSAPLVAGLVAYFRGLPSTPYGDLRPPRTVQQILRKMTRVVQVGGDMSMAVPMVWNGQLNDGTSCLIGPPYPAGCPVIDPMDINPIDHCNVWTKRNAHGQPGNDTEALFRRQGASCPLDPPDSVPGGSGPSIPGGGPQGPTRTVTYSSGSPSPTCTAGCGTLCTGYWCRPTQTGEPPHFTDPIFLPPLPTGDPVPSNCVSSVTTSTCENRYCKTFVNCLATTLPGLPTLPGGGGAQPPIPTNCAATTTWENCNPAGPACVTLSSCVSTSDPKPTGFPQAPDPPPDDTFVACGLRPDCNFKDGMLPHCDKAASFFRDRPGDTFGTGERQTWWSCSSGPDGRGGRVGCKVEIVDFTSSSGQECAYTGSEIALWWANLRAFCPRCAEMWDTKSRCGITFKMQENCCDDGGDRPECAPPK